MQHIDEFCGFAHKEFSNFYKEFTQWEITPRFDKSAPEIQYTINGKILEKKQVLKYLQIFNQELYSFEENLNEKLSLMIDSYLSR